MFNIVRKEIEFGGKTLVVETGKIARQAAGAVMVTYGGTEVLCTVSAKKSLRSGQDFFPLSVHYMERTYAAGRIPGGFFKREGRPSEKEILTCRLIDRPVRPLFPKGFMNEVQIQAQVMGHDGENDGDIPALIGASAALAISGLPFMGPIAGARVGFIDEEYVLNPTIAELEDSILDLVVAGTDEGVLMVESEADELEEDEMLGAVMFGWKAIQPVVEMLKELREEAGKEIWDAIVPEFDPSEMKDKVAKLVGKEMEKAFKITTKQDRVEAINVARAKAIETLTAKDIPEDVINAACKGVEASILRGTVLKTGKRIDGRGTADIRPIVAEVGILGRAHGSALFTRGETQAIVTATLGTGQDEKIVDALEGDSREHFMLHYNFPPYCVGEAGRVGFTSRREIGHGKLAWRALRAMMPEKEEFPYTIRIVSEITESNGSSSMATVCGASLAMMDAGVPLESPVAGIAMGLIKEGDDFAVLSDILGDEDHLGDMDFKVAGTSEGITSLQMDIKITSLTEAIMATALDQAKDARIHILGKMAEALDESRDEVSQFAPRITTVKINPEKIRDIIGTGGKVIREITEETGTKIDISDDGLIKIASSDPEASAKAEAWIQSIVAEPELNQIYQGRVVKTVDFGAFVNFLGKKDGLVHISELADHRVGKVTDITKEGEMVKVKVIGFDDRGKIKLSMRAVDQETGADISKQKEKA